MGDGMKRFIEGEDRAKVKLLPDCLYDYIAEDNPVRSVEAFVEELDLKALGFAGADLKLELELTAFRGRVCA